MIEVTLFCVTYSVETETLFVLLYSFRLSIEANNAVPVMDQRQRSSLLRAEDATRVSVVFESRGFTSPHLPDGLARHGPHDAREGPICGSRCEVRGELDS